MMSSICSIPMLSRIISGNTPALRSSSADICRWVVEAGWQTSDFASPRLTSRVTSFSASWNLTAASYPPLIPTDMSEHARPSIYFCAMA